MFPYFTTIFLRIPYYFCNFLSLIEVMGDEIQSVVKGFGNDVATDVAVRNDNGDGGELFVHPRR